MPANGRVVDLDRARAARHEAAGDPVTLRFGGQDFTLPPELPLVFFELAEEGKFREAITVLLGENADAFMQLGPSLQDLEAFADAILPAYGIDVGESAASSSSSANGGTSSRPTSNASTD